jgi:acyl carrier protein
MQTNEEKLKQLLADVFGIPADTVGEETSYENVVNWDSLNQMRLVLALEQSFRLSFSEQELGSLTSYARIREALKTHGVHQ